MFDDVYTQMMSLAIDTTENKAFKRALQIALDMYWESGAITLRDWEDMTEEEQMETIEQYVI